VRNLIFQRLRGDLWRPQPDAQFCFSTAFPALALSAILV
jgi:hypothetical protein